MGQQLSSLVENIYEQSNKKKVIVLPYNLQYVSTNQLNHGLFCRSFLTELQNKRLFVTKIIKKPKFSIRGQIALLDYYKQKLSKMQHVIPYMSYHIDADNVFLIRPYMYNTLEQFQYFHENSKDYLAVQMIACVQELHKEELVHGNIVLSNFVITDAGKVYLCDYCPYRPGYFDHSDSQYLIYFYQTIKDPARICVLPERNFIICKQQTDVFELGITLLNLYNEKECFSKQFFTQIQSQDELDTQLEPFYNEVSNSQIRQLIKQMMQLQSEKRLDLRQLDVSSLIDDQRVYYLHKSFYQYTNGCPDNDIKVVQMIIDNIRSTSDILKCLQCHLKQNISSNGQVLKQSPIFTCKNEHNFPASLAIGKSFFVENSNYNQLILIMLQRTISWLSKHDFLYQESRNEAIIVIQKIFEVLSPEFEDAGLNILLPLLQGNILTEIAEMFLHILGTITTISDKKYFLPLLIYCKYFFPVSNVIMATQKLIKYMRENEKREYQDNNNPKVNFTFDIYYSSINMVNHTRIFAAFTETVFRLLKNHRKSFVNVFEHLFCRAENSALEQFTFCVGQVHNKESLQEILLFNIFLGIPNILRFSTSIIDLFIKKAKGFPKLLNGLVRAFQVTDQQVLNEGKRKESLCQNNVIVQENILSQIQQLKTDYEQNVIDNMISTLMNVENIQNLDQSLYFMIKAQQSIICHQLLTPKKLLLGYMNYVTTLLTKKHSGNISSGNLTHNYRQCYINFFTFLVQVHFRQRQNNDFIIYLNENFQKQLIKKLLNQINVILKTNTAFCQQSSNILENKLYIKCFLDQMTKLQQLSLQNVITYIQFITEQFDVNMQASIQKQAFVITYTSPLLTMNIAQNPQQLHIYLLNIYVTHQLFLFKLEQVVQMTESFAVFNINDYVYQIFSSCKQVSWKQEKINLNSYIIQNMGYEISSINEIYNYKAITNQCVELKRINVKVLQKQFLMGAQSDQTQDKELLVDKNYISLFGTQNNYILNDSYSTIISTYNFAQNNSLNIDDCNFNEGKDNSFVNLIKYLCRRDCYAFQNQKLFTDIMAVVGNIKSMQAQIQQLKDKYQQDTRPSFEKKMRYQQQKQLIINQPLLFNLQEQVILTDIEHLVQQYLLNLTSDKQYLKQKDGNVQQEKNNKQDFLQTMIPQLRETFELCQKKQGIKQVLIYREQYIVVLDTQNNIKIFNLHPNNYLQYLRKQEKIIKRRLLPNHGIDVAYNNFENILIQQSCNKHEVQQAQYQLLQEQLIDSTQSKTTINQSIFNHLFIQNQLKSESVSLLSPQQGDYTPSAQGLEKSIKGKNKEQQPEVNMIHYMFSSNQEGQANSFSFYENIQNEDDNTKQHKIYYINGKQELLSINLGLQINKFLIDSQNILTIVTEDDQFLRYELDPHFLSIQDSFHNSDTINIMLNNKQHLVIDLESSDKQSKQYFDQFIDKLNTIRQKEEISDLDNAQNQNEISLSTMNSIQNITQFNTEQQLTALLPEQHIHPLFKFTSSNAMENVIHQVLSSKNLNILLQAVPHQYLTYLYMLIAKLKLNNQNADLKISHRSIKYLNGFTVPNLLGVVEMQNLTLVVTRNKIIFCTKDGVILTQKIFKRQIIQYLHKNTFLYLQFSNEFACYSLEGDFTYMEEYSVQYSQQFDSPINAFVLQQNELIKAFNSLTGKQLNPQIPLLLLFDASQLKQIMQMKEEQNVQKLFFISGENIILELSLELNQQFQVTAVHSQPNKIILGLSDGRILIVEFQPNRNEQLRQSKKRENKSKSFSSSQQANNQLMQSNSNVTSPKHMKQNGSGIKQSQVQVSSSQDQNSYLSYSAYFLQNASIQSVVHESVVLNSEMSLNALKIVFSVKSNRLFLHLKEKEIQRPLYSAAPVVSLHVTGSVLAAVDVTGHVTFWY